MNIFRETEIRNRTVRNSNNKQDGELNKYEKMHQVVESKIGEYLRDFANGDNESLDLEFTDGTYKQLGLILSNQNNFKNLTGYHYNSGTFIKYCSTFHRVLDGLRISIINNNTLTHAIDDLSNANLILGDAENVIKYYNTTFLNNVRFTIDTTTSLEVLSFKEEYRIYVLKYGVPDNLNFDSERLSLIRLELLLASSQPLP